MAPKRPREDDSRKSVKKQKKGFQVGPANLPDGTYRRKGKSIYTRNFLQYMCTDDRLVKKIKTTLIHKAKLKQQYAKVKAREEKEGAPVGKSVYERDAEAGDGDSDEPVEPIPEPSLEPHPDRVRMLEEASPEPSREHATERRQRRPRSQPFKKESEMARKKKEEADARYKAREEADQERAAKLAERERFRKTMAKAHGGSTGRKKLGLESNVLLAKIQRSMGKT